MGAEVDATEFTREDRKRYRDKVRKGLDVLARMLTESRFDFERRWRFEIELNLVDMDCRRPCVMRKYSPRLSIRHSRLSWAASTSRSASLRAGWPRPVSPLRTFGA